MEYQVFCKTFEELTKAELYEILMVREAVFVVEQECPYQEVDGTDQEALHVFFADKPVDEGGRIVAYLRAFPKSDDPGTIRIGRVLTMPEVRGSGMGGELLSCGLQAIINHFHPQKLYLEAQTYATGFYEREGFAICGEEFIEDGIPHIPMEKEL